MSNATPSTPDASDEASIERAVRAILFPLDRELETATTWGCSIFGFLLAPGVFCLLWLGFHAAAWSAALVALLGCFVCWMSVSAWLDDRTARRAARVFNDRFPEGHPARPVAIQMLAEMECPNKAHEKLRAALRLKERMKDEG